MEEITVSLTFEEIKDCLIRVLKKGFNILEYKQLQMYSPDFKMTILDNGSREKIYIKLKDNNLQVDSENKTLSKDVKRAIVDFIASKYDELGLLKEQLMRTAEEAGRSIETAMKNEIYKIDFNDWAKIGNIDSKYRLLANFGKIRLGNHVTFRTLDNPYYRKDSVIRIRDIFFADLDPVVGNEYGGKRPVVILGHNRAGDLYYVVPLSTEGYDRLRVGTYQGKDSFAVVDRVKSISPQRIFNYVDRLDKDVFGELQKLISEDIITTEDEPQENVHSAFDGSISYDKLNKLKNSLSAVIDMYLPEMPKESELLEILSQHAKNLENEGKIKFARVTKDGKKQLKYVLEYGLNGEITFRLNPDSNNNRNHYYQRNYSFTLFTARMNDPSKSAKKTVLDPQLTIRFQRYMIEHNECYFLHLIRYYCQISKSNYDYRRDNGASNNELQLFVTEKAQYLKEQFESVGIYYEGNFERLVKEGFNAFKIERLLPSESFLSFNLGDDKEEKE